MSQYDMGSTAHFESLYAIAELLSMLIIDPRTGVLLVLLVIAAIIDFRIYRIPNWLTFSGAAYALLYSIVVPFSLFHGFLWALGGFAIGLLVLLPLRVIRVMGAGDVKLMAMTGAFLGVSDTLYAIVFTFITGGIAALLYAAYHRVMGRMLGNIKTSAELAYLSAVSGALASGATHVHQSVGKLPYGVSICIGTTVYVVVKQLGLMPFF